MLKHVFGVRTIYAVGKVDSRFIFLLASRPLPILQLFSSVEPGDRVPTSPHSPFAMDEALFACSRMAISFQHASFTRRRGVLFTAAL